MSRRVTLSWECSDPDAGDTLKYDVYFSPDNPPVLWAANFNMKSIDVGFVDSMRVFRWQIKAKDNKGGVTLGPVWKFTTGNTK